MTETVGSTAGSDASPIITVWHLHFINCDVTWRWLFYLLRVPILISCALLLYSCVIGTSNTPTEVSALLVCV